MFKLLVMTLLLQYSSGFDTSNILYKEVFKYHNETAFKAEFAFQVVNQIYHAFRQWYFTIIFCEFTYFENRVLKYAENMGYGFPVILINGCPTEDKIDVKPRIAKDGATAYVITSEALTLEVNDFAIKALIKTGIFKPQSPLIFVINVPVEVDSYFNYQIETHFKLLWSRRIGRSVLLVWSDKLRMYIYNPYLNIISEITEMKDIDKKLSKIFHNLHGSQLRLSVFRKIFISDDKGPVKCDSRMDVTVMNFLNATCLPLVPRDGNTVGDLLENGTATGVTADLIEGYTDLELSSRILKNSFYGYIDTTYPLTQDALCFLVKKSDKQSPFTSAIKLISDKLLMLFIFIVVFLISLALMTRKMEAKILKIKEKQSVAQAMTDLLRCFLKQTTDITFFGPVFRWLALLIMIYSLVINCVIDGIITSAVTYPRFKPEINTLEELMKTNVTLGIHNRHMDLFKKSLSDEEATKVLPRVELVNDRKIKKIIDERQYHYAVLMRRTDTMIVSRKPSNLKDGRPLYHTVEECPIPCSIVYGLHYGSPVLLRINYILHHLNQGGILKFWSSTDESNLSKNLNKAEVTHEHNSENESKDKRSLKMENMKEVFFVWLGGLLVSIVALILEILLHKLGTINTTIQSGN